MINWIFRIIFAAECREIARLQALLRTAVARAEQRAALRPAARIKLEGGLPYEEIVRRLRGTEQVPIVQAIAALLDAKIVEMCDRGTNPPSASFTQELRTYEGGGANAISEFKVALDEMTGAATEEHSEPFPTNDPSKTS